MDPIEEKRFKIVYKFEKLIEHLEDEDEDAVAKAKLILRVVRMHEDFDQLATVFRGILHELDQQQELIDDRPHPWGQMEKTRIQIIHRFEQLVGRLDDHEPEAVTEAQLMLVNVAENGTAGQLATVFRGIVQQFDEDRKILDNPRDVWGPFVREFAGFSNALAAFREVGGAMHYRQATREEPSCWLVGPCDEIAEATGYNPRKCTVNALRRGGMSDKQINAELADREDPPENDKR